MKQVAVSGRFLETAPTTQWIPTSSNTRMCETAASWSSDGVSYVVQITVFKSKHY
jgi:hypothetical protein